MIAAQAFGHDFRHGTIRLTMAAFPKRMQILIARVGVMLVWVVVVSVVTIAGVAAGIQLKSATSGGMEWDSFPGTAARFIAYLVGYMLIVVSLVVLSRNLALGLVVPLVMVLIVENLLLLIAYVKYPWIVDYLPFTNGIRWVTNAGGFGNGPGPVHNGNSAFVFFSVVVALVVAGTWRFKTRDA